MYRTNVRKGIFSHELTQMDTNDKKVVYKELSYKIVGLAMEVHKKLGYGFLEKVYENAMMIELKKEGISAISQFPVRVSYEGEVIGEYYADIMVDDKVIVEIKATKRLVEENEAQLLNYLKAAGLGVGLIINFGPSVQVKRMVL